MTEDEIAPTLKALSQTNHEWSLTKMQKYDQPGGRFRFTFRHTSLEAWDKTPHWDGHGDTIEEAMDMALDASEKKIP